MRLQKRGKKSVIFLTLSAYYEREKNGYFPDSFTQNFREEKLGKKPTFSEGKKKYIIS